IMNPHFPDYYRTSGQKSPSDWQSPNPVTFLTVSETTYRFAVAARTEDAVSLLETAERWLRGALTKLGVGAKTSADYGYWNIV
ncbi:MAG: type III-B CRISPR module RAMP protein Cmr6, partial [Anaerolineae bacterium]|nr:type III-B CRISPR module RAMP protein Cmr6 [Anaerolineae bacterium]